jgi:predicted nucleic acid-binding protein
VNNFYSDASALVKQYTPEAGTLLLNHLFSRVALDHMTALNVGVAEVASIIVRKRNDGRITTQVAAQALANLGTQVVYSPAFSKIPVTNAMIPSAISLISTHSINSTDAFVLLTALDLANKLRLNGEDLVLVTSDHQLLKAARAEGLTTFDPATQSQADLDALIGP